MLEDQTSEIYSLATCVFIFALGTMVARTAQYAAIRLKNGSSGQMFKFLVANSFHCDVCRGRLSALVWTPIIGWLIPIKCCNSCRTSVPWAFSHVELSVGLVSLVILAICGESANFFAVVFTFWICFLLSWLDLKLHYIPQFGTYLLLFVGLLLSPFELEPIMRSSGAAISALCMWTSLTLVGLLKNRNTDAGGDVSMAAAAGAWVGFAHAPTLLFISSLFFIVHAAALRKKHTKVWIPLAPSLSCGLMSTLGLIQFF